MLVRGANIYFPYKMKKVTILIPCYNEEKSVPLLYDSLNKITSNISDSSYKFNFLFINDGSTDNTFKILKTLRNDDNRVGYVDLSRNFGKEAALLAGFDHSDGDAVIIIDADLQHPPELIPLMLKEWENGYEDVYAKRETKEKESWLRARLRKIYYTLLQNTSRNEILRNVGDFRLLDKKCIDELCKLREKGRYTKGMYSWIGFRKKELTYLEADRVEGVSHWSLGNLFSLALDGLTSNTIAPLRLSTLLGFIISLSAFSYMFFIILRTIIYGEPVKGFPTLIVIILFLGGIQLISLGIIGEYIGRIFIETKNRPVYVIREVQK